MEIRMKRMVLIAVVFSAGLSYLSSRGAGAGAAESGLDLRGKRVVEAVDYEYEIPYPGESRSITAGGLSGLWYAGEEDGMGIFYTVSDRGPQSRRIGSVPGDKPEDTRRNERIFDDPDFPTTVYKLGWNGEDVKTLDSFPLLMPDGKGGFRPATGIGQLDDDDASWHPNSTDSEGFNDYSEIPRDAFGIDAEAILLLSLPGVNNGRPVFVISDEYRPMIVFFDAETHRLVKRLVPANTNYSAIEYENGRGEVPEYTVKTLPAVYSQRRANRGLEALAYHSRDNLLYGFMQSPMSAGGKKSASELRRVIVIEPDSGKAVSEYVYLQSHGAEVDKIGDAVFNPRENRFVVIDRGSSGQYIVNFDFTEATNTLDIDWREAVGAAQPELLSRGELESALEKAGIRQPDQTTLHSLGTTSEHFESFDKPEGLALTSDALFINYDNDFLSMDGRPDNMITRFLF